MLQHTVSSPGLYWSPRFTSFTSRLRGAGSWVAPSAVAACIGALMAGLVEALGTDIATGLATIGFLAIVAVPTLFVGSVATRGIIAAWRPRRLVEELVEDGGGAPRLVGWIATIALVCLIVALGVYVGTGMLARSGNFQPQIVGFVEPVIVVCCAGIAFAVSRPTAHLIARLARHLDDRRRRRGRATALRPRTIVIASILAIAIALLGAWFLFVKPRLGPFDTTIIYAPLAGIAIAVFAHAGFKRLRRKWLGGAIGGMLAVGSIVFALASRATDPSLAIEIWSDRTFAGLAVDAVYDIDSIRADISLAQFRPVDRPGAAHPDIVLITIDTVRADHTPAYGGKADMPVLAKLAERGAVFEWAFAPSNVTRRSIPSMVIGYAPNRIRGRVVGWALRIDPRFVLLAERLRAGGYETAGFMCCDGFWGKRGKTGLQRGLEHLTIEHDGKQLGKLARAWLEMREASGSRAPLFVWIHLLEPHNWTHGGSAPNTSDARDTLYDRALATADAILANLIAPFSKRSPDRAPITIVTADHGEALGDHNTPFHSTDLYNSQIRVPLVVTGPGIPAARLGETVSLTDLVPTIVELAGFHAPTGLDGRSLADAITGKRPSPADTGTAYAAMIKDRSNPGGVQAFVKGRWKLIAFEGGTVELYDVISDPNERMNVASQRPDLVRELSALLEAKQAAGSFSPF